MTIITVAAGDTLTALAREAGISVGLLAELNGIDPADPLAIGQALLVREPEQTVTVAAGDTLTGIARRAGITLRQMYRNNPGLGGLPAIVPGQELVVRYRDTPTASANINAYAYPNISDTLLRETLPYLTDMTPFTYSFTLAGELLPLSDQRLLDLALSYGVTPWMHLSTLEPGGTFNNVLGLRLLEDPALQDKVIEAILQNMRDKRYGGLDVDFEFLGKAGAAPYAAFITRLRERLSPLGLEVIVALAPKISPDQPGELYEGHDYALVGAAADGVLLMTYEWGYTYGPPMAVAPIPSVRRVLDYAVTEIPREKIFMGIPTYGYDWPLPFERGVTKAKSLSNPKALALARQYGAEIQFDTSAQTPFFDYTAEDGTAHEVWFEDARSMAAKFALIREYGFRGAGYWSLDRPFPQNWSLLNSTFDVDR